MGESAGTTEEYSPQFFELVKATALYVCTVLGDYIEDFVVAGGLVPSLIISQDTLPEGADIHVGTRDLDIGFSLAVLDESRYHEIAERLRSSGFEPDKNPGGNPTFQRWKHSDDLGVTIDFLIPLTDDGDVGGTLKNLEPDFAAFIVPGLELAFRDRILVSLSGETIFGETASRDVWVCGPGAFVVLKAHAFRFRGTTKDAYDLFYVVRNYGNGPPDVAKHLTSLLDSEVAVRAIRNLEEDFAQPNFTGPVRVALFVEGSRNEDIQADVAGFIRELLQLCKGSSTSAS